MPHDGRTSAWQLGRAGSAGRQAGRPGRTHAGRGAPFRAWFARLATRASDAVGSVWAFLAVLTIIAVWLISGPIFGFSDTWQLVMNTVSSIVTFVLVFLIQNAQNRDSKATQLKLDELIRAAANARNQFIAAEREPEEQLDQAKRTVESAKTG